MKYSRRRKSRKESFKGDNVPSLFLVLKTILLKERKQKTILGYYLILSGALSIHERPKAINKTDSKLDSLVQSGLIFSNFNKMEFDLPKHVTVVMRRRKLVTTAGIELTSGKVLKAIKLQSSYIHPRIIEANGINNDMTKKTKKRVLEASEKIIGFKSDCQKHYFGNKLACSRRSSVQR